MFNPFLTVSLFFSIATVLLIIYIIFYFNLIGGFNEIYWKIIYGLGLFLFLLCLFFFRNEDVLNFFLCKVNEVIIIKDLQDLVNISLDISVIFTLYLILPIWFVLGLTYIKSYLLKSQINFLIMIVCLLLYYYIFFIIILNNDLFLSSWDFFNQKNNYNYDFQPDFVYIILSYIGDFYDLLFYCLIIVLYFYYQVKIQSILYQNQFYKNKVNIWIRLCFHGILSFFIFYFFGGEAFYLDFLLFFLSLCFLEFFYFLILFLYNLKRKV